MNATYPTSAVDRALRLAGYKVLTLFVLAPLLSICYYLPQWMPLITPRRIPLTFIDRMVPFEPGWIWPYMSMYIMILLPPLFAMRLDHLRRYAAGMAIMFVVSAIFFFLCPIEYPRPATPANPDVLYHRIITIDRPINSLPSLHAGMTVYAILFASKGLADIPNRNRRAILAAGWLWAGIILYGTLATKQHYFVDLPAGAVVAWAAHWFVWRGYESLKDRKNE